MKTYVFVVSHVCGVVAFRLPVSSKGEGGGDGLVLGSEVGGEDTTRFRALPWEGLNFFGRRVLVPSAVRVELVVSGHVGEVRAVGRKY